MARQIAGLLAILDSLVKALAETFGKVILDTICHQLDDVSGPVEDGRAVRARLEVGLHSCAKLRVNLAVNKIRDFPPDL